MQHTLLDPLSDNKTYHDEILLQPPNTDMLMHVIDRAVVTVAIMLYAQYY